MIRRAVQADLPEIYQLICALEETAFPKEIFTWGYDAILANSSHLLLVAEEQGKVQGVLHLRMEFQLHHCDRIAEIMELIVSPAARSKGDNCGERAGAAAPLCADRSDQQPKTNQRPPFLPAGRSDADARETDAADNRITKKVLTMCNLQDKNLFHL